MIMLKQAKVIVSLRYQQKTMTYSRISVRKSGMKGVFTEQRPGLKQQRYG